MDESANAHDSDDCEKITRLVRFWTHCVVKVKEADDRNFNNSMNDGDKKIKPLEVFSVCQNLRIFLNQKSTNYGKDCMRKGTESDNKRKGQKKSQGRA